MIFTETIITTSNTFLNEYDRTDITSNSLSDHSIEQILQTSHPFNWSPPPSGAIKINVDGAIDFYNVVDAIIR